MTPKSDLHRQQVIQQKFVRLYLFVAIPAIFWIGVAGLIGAFQFGQTDTATFVLMSPGVAILLICAAVSLFLARILSVHRVVWALIALACLAGAFLTHHLLSGWYGERDAFLNCAISIGSFAVILAFFLRPDTGDGLTPRYSVTSLTLTFLGTLVSVTGSYLMVERDLLQGEHYVQVRASLVGQTLQVSFNQPINSVQRMTDRWRSLDTWPSDAFIRQEFRSHLRDMPSIERFSVIEKDGKVSADIQEGSAKPMYLETLLKSEMAFWAFLDTTHKSGQARLSAPGLLPEAPQIAFIAAPIGNSQEQWGGAVVATVDLGQLVRSAFASQSPPCCFVAKGNQIEFYRSPEATDTTAVAMADEAFLFPRMFPLEVTFWKEKLPGEVGMSSYPVWVLVVGLLFTFFGNASQRLAQLAMYRANLLQDRALQDPLTGLPNRRKLRRMLQSAYRTRHAVVPDNRDQPVAVSDDERPSRPSLMFIDMRGLRLINDSLGHELGDRLIVKLAARLEQLLERTFPGQMRLHQVLLARVDGGEFVIFLKDASDELLTGLAESILQSLSEAVDIDGRELTVSAHIGISRAQADICDPMRLVREADLALLTAKQEGARRWAQYDEEMGHQAALRMTLSQELKRSLAAGELTMVYQPLIDACTGQIVAMEALVRWQHHEHGMISPAQFIPMAEESGQIVELTNWTLLQACSDSSGMRTQKTDLIVPVAVNISPIYFQRDDFVQQIRRMLDKTGISPRQLQLEITEGVLLRDQSEAVGKLKALGDLGIVTSLDDFGTGYSSLSYLKNLPIHKVKLDRSFVVDVTTNKADAEVVRGVIEIVHNLNMVVVIEGVETPEQARLLRELESDQFQGYLFSRPLPAQSIQELLRQASNFLEKLDDR